jgi:hypothetical protein
MADNGISRSVQEISVTLANSPTAEEIRDAAETLESIAAELRVILARHEAGQLVRTGEEVWQ